MMHFKALGGIFLLLLLNGASVQARVKAVEKPAEPFDEGFLEAVAGEGTQRELRLGSCQSDCDSNSDCASGLFCWQRRTRDPLPPCCSGSQPSDSRDFCVPNGCSSGGGGGDSGGGGDTSIDVGIVVCFSGDTIVDVMEKGSLPMKDLQVGDKILSAAGYQPVYSFAHKHATKIVKFLVVHTDDDKFLEISADHLIFVQHKSNPVRAESIMVGDKLAPSGAIVTAIGQTTKAGIYAPLTPDATFLLNDGAVQVSSYAAIVQTTHDEYATFRDGTKFIPQHTGVHMVLTPYRMFCRAFQCDSYNHDGMPPYIANGIRFLEWMDHQNYWFQVILFVLAFPIFGTMILLERIVFIGPGLFVALGLGVKLVWGQNTSSMDAKKTV